MKIRLSWFWSACGRTEKAQYWQRWAGTPINARQTLVLNQVPNGMEAKPTHAKWAAPGKCSADTALRDTNDLLARGVLDRFDSRETECPCVFWPIRQQHTARLYYKAVAAEKRFGAQGGFSAEVKEGGWA